MEYRLRFAYPDEGSLEALLRLLPFVRGPVSSGTLFELRSTDPTGEMPDAMMKIEPCGAYFCDNGGKGRQMLGLVIARLVSQFGSVAVEEWE
jgi:hypothetical protein